MAITIQELIAQKDNIKSRKARHYDIETSIGQITVKAPSSATVSDSIDMSSSFDGNCLLVLNCVIEPNLKDSELQKAYQAAEPIDVVKAIFMPGEVNRIADKLLDFAGFKGKLVTNLHEQVKN